MTRIRTMIAALTLAIAPAVCAADDALLTFSHGNKVTEFDREELVALGAEEISTTTIWTEGIQTFTGVSLHAFLQEVGVTEGTLKATAVNDYAVEVPVEDAVEGGPIIAYLSNGEQMSLREKGPLWIVYPYDSDPKYQTEVIYSRSIWQLDRIEVIE